MSTLPYLFFCDLLTHDKDTSLELRPVKGQTNAPAKGHLTLRVTLDSPAAETRVDAEDVHSQLDGPEVPAIADRVFKAGDVAVPVVNDVSATWTTLQPLGALFKSTKFDSLVDAVDKLAKVCVGLL